MRYYLFFLIFILSTTAKSEVKPAVGLILGYNNPGGADLGLNIMIRSLHFGFEGGIGYSRRDLASNDIAFETYTSDVQWPLELDLKIFLGPKHAEIFLEGGVVASYLILNQFPFVGFYVVPVAGAGLSFSTEGNGKGYTLGVAGKYAFDSNDETDPWLLEVSVGYGFY